MINLPMVGQESKSRDDGGTAVTNMLDEQGDMSVKSRKLNQLNNEMLLPN